MNQQNAVPRISKVLLLSACFSSSLLYAQSERESGTIHATGQHEIALAPQKLRLTLTIRAEGADAKSAIESLLEHKERVKSELLAMKAEEASIDFGAAQLSSGIPGMSSEMMRYGSQVIAQIAGNADANPTDVPKVYTAVSRLRAEWPLPTTDADALAMLPETLKEQVKERDLIGEKNKAQLESSQQEKLEEMQAAMQENMGYYSSSTETSPVTVMFVAKIDEADRKAAVVAAYERAMAQAKMLASVTEKPLGSLKSLRASDVPLPATEEIESTYGPAFAAYATFAPGPINSLTADEALNESPKNLKLIVRVEAEFALAE
jgi:uncharacterized protein YggE